MITVLTAILIALNAFFAWAAAMGFVHRSKTGLVISAILSGFFAVAALIVGRFM